MTSRRSLFLSALSIAMTTMLASSSVADGSFFQLDWTGSDLTMVGSEQRGQLTFGATTIYSGESAELSARVVHGFPLPWNIDGKVGPELQFSRNSGVVELDGGLFLSADRWQPTFFGSFYWLAELHSIENAWFTSVQFGFTGSSVLEISSGGSDTYNDSAIAISRRLGDGPWLFRAGYRLKSDVAFFGLIYNTY